MTDSSAGQPAEANRSVPPASALAFRGVTFGWPEGAKVFSGLDLSVAPGESVALLGANGTGKTTLMLLAAGCLVPDAGTVAVDGLPVTPAHLAEVRRRLGLVFQDAADQLFLPTVLEDVAFGPLMAGMDRAEARKRAEATLRSLGVEALAPRAPHRLSGGEIRRAALATALALSPAVLLLDEPTAGLDARGRARLAETLVALTPACLVATHDLEFARAVCSRAVILDGGQVAADGSLAELLDDADLLRRSGLRSPIPERSKR